ERQVDSNSRSEMEACFRFQADGELPPGVLSENVSLGACVRTPCGRTYLAFDLASADLSLGLCGRACRVSAATCITDRRFDAPLRFDTDSRRHRASLRREG